MESIRRTGSSLVHEENAWLHNRKFRLYKASKLDAQSTRIYTDSIHCTSVKYVDRVQKLAFVISVIVVVVVVFIPEVKILASVAVKNVLVIDKFRFLFARRWRTRRGSTSLLLQSSLERERETERVSSSLIRPSQPLASAVYKKECLSVGSVRYLRNQSVISTSNQLVSTSQGCCRR